MKILECLVVLTNLIIVAICAPAWADDLEHSATLHCDLDGNRALIVLDGTTEYANRAVPKDIDLGLSDIAPAPSNVCRLKDGREIKVRSAHDQVFPYGECGADPMAFLSLWVDERKVLSRYYFYGGCHQGLILKAVLLNGDRLTKCEIASPDAPSDVKAGALICTDATEALAAAKIDAIEYPPAGVEKPRFGSIEVRQAEDRAFCERFVDRALPFPRARAVRDGLLDRRTTGDIFRPTAVGEPVTAGEKVQFGQWQAGRRQFDADNDGALDDVIWLYGTVHVFDGDVFLIEPKEPDLAAALSTHLSSPEGLRKSLAWARSQGIVVYNGRDTPYQTERYTHFWPIILDGRTLLWAWPTNAELLPTAFLYRSGPAGSLMPICTFQRVEENF